MKKISRYFFFVYAMLLSMLSFAQDKGKYIELSQLRDMLTGDFRSTEKLQVGRQPDYVVVQSRPIWQDRTDGYWLYLEQFVAVDDNLPALQTVLHFYVSKNQDLVCDTYALTDPSAFASATRQQSLLQKLSYAGLKKNDACPIAFQKKGDVMFVGKTLEMACNLQARGYVQAALELVKNEFTVNYANMNQPGGQSTLPFIAAAKYQRVLPE